MNKNAVKKYSKMITATFIIPLIVYLVMMAVCGGNGILFNIFSYDSFSTIMKSAAYMAIVALGIGFQLKYGRFDFSGGAIIVVSATIGGVLCDVTGLGIWFLLLSSVVVGMLLSFINSFIYVSIRIPVSVCSLAIAYLFEAIPGIVLNGKTGPNILYRDTYTSLGLFPLILLPLAIAVIIYFVYGRFTVAGRQSTLLRENQLASVNIGINEKKNTIITYLISGLLFGLAGAIYATQNELKTITTPLETAGTLFSNIIPSLVGLFLSRYIDDSLGTFVGAFTISTLYYGLDLVGVQGGAKTLSYALFLAVFIFISGFWDQIIMYIKYYFRSLIGKFKKTNVENG